MPNLGKDSQSALDDEQLLSFHDRKLF
jgi:hypothetical protein